MKTLSLFLILLLPVVLFSQGKNEFKIDALGAFNQGYEFSYERIIKKKLGIEIGLRLNNDQNRLDTIPFDISTFNPEELTYLLFDKKTYMANLHLKYYPFQKTMGEGLMFGAFFRYGSKPEFEQSYFDAYEKYKGEAAPEAMPSMTVGGSFGYKFLWKERIIIEPLLDMGINLIRPYPNERGDNYAIGGAFKIKAGYRF